jgi:hypothetical protein
MKIKEYIIEIAADPKNLATKVNARIKIDFQPFGSPFVAVLGGDKMQTFYCQAVVKHESSN